MGSLWNRSGTIERFGADDLKAPGAKAFFFQGGTTTPWTVYSNAAETIAHPNPVVADANGRWPNVFVPFISSYDVQVKTADNVQLTFTQLIPNINPTDTFFAGIPFPVDTGMIHGEVISTTKTGYVRCNGRTIGNAASGGTERANADTSALFSYLWNNLPNAQAPVSGGRGASASADFAANKNIGLPDLRGRTMIGLDDMGAAAAGAFTGLTFVSGSGTTPASFIGSNGLTLTIAQLPAHTHTGTTALDGTHVHGGTVSGTTDNENANHSHLFSGTTGNNNADHTHSYTYHSTTGAALLGSGASFGTPNQVVAGNTGIESALHQHGFSGTTGIQSAVHQHTFSAFLSVNNVASEHTHNFTTAATGTGAIVNNMQLSMTVTWFIKL